MSSFLVQKNRLERKDASFTVVIHTTSRMRSKTHPRTTWKHVTRRLKRQKAKKEGCEEGNFIEKRAPYLRRKMFLYQLQMTMSETKMHLGWEPPSDQSSACCATTISQECPGIPH